jgi:hypothetical protein
LPWASSCCCTEAYLVVRAPAQNDGEPVPEREVKGVMKAADVSKDFHLNAKELLPVRYLTATHRRPRPRHPYSFLVVCGEGTGRPQGAPAMPGVATSDVGFSSSAHQLRRKARIRSTVQVADLRWHALATLLGAKPGVLVRFLEGTDSRGCRLSRLTRWLIWLSAWNRPPRRIIRSARARRSRELCRRRWSEQMLRGMCNPRPPGASSCWGSG